MGERPRRKRLEGEEELGKGQDNLQTAETGWQGEAETFKRTPEWREEYSGSLYIHHLTTIIYIFQVLFYVVPTTTLFLAEAFKSKFRISCHFTWKYLSVHLY